MSCSRETQRDRLRDFRNCSPSPPFFGGPRTYTVTISGPVMNCGCMYCMYVPYLLAPVCAEMARKQKVVPVVLHIIILPQRASLGMEILRPCPKDSLRETPLSH